MTKTFLILTLHTFKNRIVSRFKRLRQPRYLISTIAGFAYFWLVFLRRSGVRVATARSLPFNAIGLDCFGFVVLVLMLMAWAMPDESGGLEFSEAEIQFLFAGPVSRRQLLYYKVLRSQPQLLITTIVATFFGARGLFIGVWAALNAMNAYFMFVAMGRARLKLLGIGFWTRLVAVFAALAGVGALLWREIDPKLAMEALSMNRVGAALEILDAPFHRFPLSILFFLPRTYAEAAYPRVASDLVMAISIVIVSAALLLWLAGQLNVAFEEASLRVSAARLARRTSRMNRMTGRTAAYNARRGPLFRLREQGLPEVALLWKNLTASNRAASFRGMIIVCLIPVIANIIVGQFYPIALKVGGPMTLVLAGIFALVGPIAIRNDLRFDLPKLEILKSFPLRGERLIAAEMAAPLVTISILETILILAGFIHLRLSLGPASDLAFFASPEFVVLALVLVVPLAALQLLIQNAAVVFFPAWAVPSREDVRGFAASGQRFVFLIAHVFVLVVALIPAAILFVPAILLVNKFFVSSSLAVAICAMPPVMVIVGEIWLGLKFLGAQFDNLDVSSDLDTATA